MSMKRQSRVANGFTIVELLVVLTVISLLLALLLPALGSAREVGRASVCINNSRQIALCTLNQAAQGGAWPYQLESALLVPNRKSLICPDDPTPGILPESLLNPASNADASSPGDGPALAQGPGANPSPLSLLAGLVESPAMADSETYDHDSGDDENGYTETKNYSNNKPVSISNKGLIYTSYNFNPEYAAYQIHYDKIKDMSKKVFAFEGLSDKASASNYYGAYTSVGGQTWFDGTNVTITHWTNGKPKTATLQTVTVAQLASHTGSTDPTHHDLIGNWINVNGVDAFASTQLDYVTRHYQKRFLGTVSYMDGHVQARNRVASDMFVYPNGAPY